MRTKTTFADTNLFLRYLTDDVPAQADAVEQLLLEAADGKIALVTNALVIAEMVWTLESFYKQSRPEIETKVLAILNTPGLDVEDSDLILQAVNWYASKNIDFIDAYNAGWLLAQGMDAVYTFDQRHFSRLEGIYVKVPGDNAG